MTIENFKIVLGVIGADCHAVGNKILHEIMKNNGFDVKNLGVMVSQEEFVLSAFEHKADAILVSSIYGHGEIDCQGLRDLCEERGLYNIILYVGGNLVIGKRPFAEVEIQFKQMGFDRVFQPTSNLLTMIDALKADIIERRSTLIGHNFMDQARLDDQRPLKPRT